MTASERRRVRVLFAGLGCVPVFLAGWFGWLQVLQAGELTRDGRSPLTLTTNTADVQRDRREDLPGPRGTIVDRHGATLAMDCDAYEVRAEVRPPRTARVDIEHLRDYCDTLARRLADALTHDPGLSDRAAARAAIAVRLAQRLALAFDLGKLPATGPLPATVPAHAEILVEGEVAVLSAIEALEALDGQLSSVLLHLQHRHTRIYPDRELTYGLVGYLEDVPVRDQGGRVTGYRAEAPLGLEAIADLQPGAPGQRHYRVDSQSRRFYSGVGAAAAVATRLESTLDFELQKAAARELERGAQAVTENGGALPLWGALVLVEIETGDVLAAASWHRDVEHARGVAFTPYQQLYEPGSIVKPLVFALALQRGQIDWERDRFDCRSSGSEHSANVAEAGGRLVRDDHACHDDMSARDILVNSSNIGAVKVGSRFERDTWQQYLEIYGFDRSLDLPLPHERVGRPSSVGWRPGISAGAFRKWTGASYSIGYEQQVNALQMARAYLTMLTGHRRELRLVRAIEVDGVRRELPVTVGPLEFAPTTVEALVAAMIDVVDDVEGSTGRLLARAFRKEGTELHGLLAGKTGTAKSQTTIAGRGKVEVRNASFVGFAPANAPRYLVVSVLQKDDSARFYGGSYAAPPAARLMLEALRLEDRRRLRQGPQVSATPGASGRSLRAAETSQAGR